MPETRTAGAIYDLGYQRYEGERLGRNHSIATLIRYSFRTAFGIGRGSRAKLIPFACTAIIMLQAIATIWIASAVGNPDMVNYAGHLTFAAFLLALFVATQAPELVVTDKQQGVLALYLSRPMTAADYALSKMFALTGAMLVITLGPMLVMFGGKILLSATPVTAFKSEYGVLGPIIGGSLMTSIFIASLGLALSSLASRRAYATASVIGIFLFLPAAAAIVRTVATGSVRKYSALANPILVITGMTNWLFDVQSRRRSIVTRLDLPGEAYLYLMIAVTIVCGFLLVWRYRRHHG